MFVCKCFSSRPIMKTTPVMYGGEEEKVQPFIPEVEEIIFSYIYASTPVQLNPEPSKLNASLEYVKKRCLKGLKFLRINGSPVQQWRSINTAIDFGYLDVVKYLYSWFIEFPEFRNEFLRRNDLRTSAGMGGFLEIFKYFLEEPTYLPNKPLILTFIMYRGYVDIVDYALKSGRAIVNKERLITSAVQSGVKENVLLALQFSTAEYNKIAIKTAIEMGYLGIVKLLVQHCSSFEISDNLIDIAAERGYLEIVKCLLESDCNNRCTPDAIRFAAEKGYLEIVKLLIEHGKPYNPDVLFNSPFPKIQNYIKEKIDKQNEQDYTINNPSQNFFQRLSSLWKPKKN